MRNISCITWKNQINIILFMDLYIYTDVWSLVGLSWINYTHYSNAKEVKNSTSSLYCYLLQNIALRHSPWLKVSVFQWRGTERENKLWSLHHIPCSSITVTRRQISEIQLRIPPRNHTYPEVMWLKMVHRYPVTFKIFYFFFIKQESFWGTVWLAPPVTQE